MHRFRIAFAIVLYSSAVTAVAQPDRVAVETVANLSDKSPSSATTTVSTAEAAGPDLFTGSLRAIVPIQLPAARGGFVPPMKFQYRNSHYNSWLGVGWDLRPGAIERNVLKGVDYSSDDYVMDNGSSRAPLVLVGNGRFAPQLESGFLRIRKLTAEDQLPYWEVTDKVGTRYEYGRDGSSRSDDPNNASRIFSWLLQSARDTHGNTIVYEYEKVPGAAREVYLRRIRYSSNGSLAAPHSVEFLRESRPDVAEFYWAGFPTQVSQRLVAIDILSLGHRQRRYDLAYAVSDASGSSLLVSVTEADRDAANHLSPTVMQYASKQEAWVPERHNGPGPGTPIWKQCLSGDFNGDGKLDVACYTGVGGNWHIGLSGDGGFTLFMVTGAVNPQDSDAGARCFAGDLNGDGNADIACYTGRLTGHPGHWQVSYGSNSSAWTTVDFSGGPDVAFPIGNQCLNGDYDGDGKMDIACYSGPGSGGNWHLAVSTGDGFAPPRGGAGIDLPDMLVTSHCFGGDFNGDTKADIACYTGSLDGNPGEWRVALSTGFAWNVVVFANKGPNIATPIPDSCLTGDFNGDGKTDIACYSGPGTQGNWHVALSTGSGWAAPWGGAGIDVPSANRCVAGDFNGDGRADIACYGGELLTDWIVAYSTGSSWRKHTIYFGGPMLPFFTKNARDFCTAGDVNGDGKGDIVCFQTPDQWVRLRPPPGGDDLLTSITTPAGGKTTITYGSSVSTPGSRIGFAIPVVQSISVSDGRGGVSVTSYEYEGGYFYAPDRDFRGFEHVHVVGPAGPDGAREIHDLWFHQGNDTGFGANNRAVPAGFTKGKVYLDQLTDQNGFRRAERSTDFAPATGLSRFHPPQRVDDRTCDVGGSCLLVRSLFTYDAFGNVVDEDHLGEVDPSTDDSTDHWKRTRTYASNEDNWIVALPARSSIFDHGRLLSQTDYYYDQSKSCDSASTSQTPDIGNLTRVVWRLDGKQDSEMRMNYDQTGNMTCMRNANGATTLISYDPTATTAAQIQDPTGHVMRMTQFEPDTLDAGPYGHVRTFTDVNGKTVLFTYDAFGQMSKILYPDNSWVSYEYADLGNPALQRVVVKDSGGLTAISYRDGLGRQWLEKMTAADGKMVASTTDYDARGLLIRRSAPYFDGDQPYGFSAYSYDTLQRLTRTIHPDGSVRSECYEGWTRISLDENGHVRRYSSDAFNNLTMVEEFTKLLNTCDPKQLSGVSPYAVTRNTYNANRQILSTVDAKGNKTEVDYDALGRVTEIRDPDRGTTAYLYDANGNVSRVTDATGTAVFYHYDSLDRLVQTDFGSIKPPGQGDRNFKWDGAVQNGIGRLASATEGGTVVAFEYDSLGRQVKRIYNVQKQNFPLSFEYDSSGRLERVTYPDSSAVSYAYNGALLDRVTEGQNTYARYGKYDEFGNAGSIQLGNGETFERTYARASNAMCPQNTFRLCSAVVKNSQGNVLTSSQYAFDPAGNVTSIVQTHQTDRFEYDERNRLTSAARSVQGGSEFLLKFNYDEIGNIALNSAIGAYTYGPKPHAVISAGPGHYSYDANGNLTASPHFALRYDALNRLIDVRQVDGNIFSRIHMQMVYAATGDRVAVRTGLTWAINLGDLYRCTNKKCAKVVYGSNERIGLFSTGTASYLIPDHLGSTAAVLDGGGKIAAAFSYFPFGGNASPSAGGSPTPAPYQFTGKELDRSGLYYFGSRYYDPVIGRFISPDPVSPPGNNPQSLNRYSYVLNNPLRWVDRNGQYEADPSGGSNSKDNADPDKSADPEGHLINGGDPGPPPRESNTPSSGPAVSDRQDKDLPGDRPAPQRSPENNSPAAEPNIPWRESPDSRPDRPPRPAPQRIADLWQSSATPGLGITLGFGGGFSIGSLAAGFEVGGTAAGTPSGVTAGIYGSVYVGSGMGFAIALRGPSVGVTKPMTTGRIFQQQYVSIIHGLGTVAVSANLNGNITGASFSPGGAGGLSFDRAAVFGGALVAPPFSGSSEGIMYNKW